MRAELRPGADDIIVGIDLAAREHQAVIVDAVGRRLTRFRVAHSREGIAELLRRSRAKRWRATGRLFAFEATGHVWEALAAILERQGERYVIVNPLAVFRLRESTGPTWPCAGLGASTRACASRHSFQS